MRNTMGRLLVSHRVRTRNFVPKLHESLPTIHVESGYEAEVLMNLALVI